MRENTWVSERVKEAKERLTEDEGDDNKDEDSKDGLEIALGKDESSEFSVV